MRRSERHAADLLCSISCFMSHVFLKPEHDAARSWVGFINRIATKPIFPGMLRKGYHKPKNASECSRNGLRARETGGGGVLFNKRRVEHQAELPVVG